MTATAADPTAALCDYLTAQVGALLSLTPVSGTDSFKGPLGVPAAFRPELPRGFDELMPVACLVVRPAGGYQMFGNGSLPVTDPRVDVVCFGSSELEAQNIARSVALALKALRPSRYGHTLLHWARLSGGGPLPLIDPDTLWPCCVVSAQVMHAEAALP